MTESDSTTPVMTYRFPAKANQLKVVRERILEVASRCGCSDAAARDVVIAVDEACQNIIRHAYAGHEDGQIVLECRHEGDDIVVLLRDFAATVDASAIQSSRDLDDVRPGGLGTHFMHTVMDRVEFLPPPQRQGNLLRMIKRIT